MSDSIMRVSPHPHPHPYIPPHINAYIFDIDGTLLDSMGLWAQVDSEFFSRRGLVIPDDYVLEITPMSMTEAAVYTKDRFGLAQSIEAICDEWTSLVRRAYAVSIKMKPGALSYLLALKAAGHRLAVATSLSADLYAVAMGRHDIAQLFDVICSTDDVGIGKKHPAIYELVAERLAALPGDCVVFDDLHDALCSAKLAGMYTCAILDESSRSQWARICANADTYVSDFTEFK